MTDVYRQPGRGCPACGGARLREFGERLVCDDCTGMLIGEADFANAIHELDGKAAALTISDAQASAKVCPRCTRAMETVTIAAGKQRIDERVLRCSKHGVWIPQELMTAVFARASRSGKAGSQRAFDPGRASGFGQSGLGGAMRSVAQAFQPAAGRLVVNRWKAEKPTVHTLYVSAFKDRQLGCPACDGVALDYRGDRWDCETCHGAFVEPAALAAMVSEITSTPWVLPAMTGAPGDRLCPVCQTKMTTESLEGVTTDGLPAAGSAAEGRGGSIAGRGLPAAGSAAEGRGGLINRCEAHGVWFDDAELEQALHHAAVGEPKSIGGWLRKLFGRSQVAL